MAELETNWDAIVIGAGLGGLCAAARMSKAGLRVLVLEQHVYAGGYAHHFLRKVRGTKIVYDFDVALHQTGDLTPGRNMHRVLSDLDVLPRLRLNRFDIAFRTRGPAHDLQVPADADAYEALLCETYPEQAGGVRDLFQAMREIDRPGDDGGPSPAAFASMGLSLKELLDAHVPDERVQAIFSTLWGYIGLIPSQASAFLYARMWASYHFGGCFYPQGGGQALSDALVHVIEAHRGQVLLQTEVTSIVTEAGHVVGVETRGRGAFRAPVVVSNAAELRALEAGDLRAQGWMLGNHNLADPGHAPPGRSILHSTMMADGRLWEGLDDASYRQRKQEVEAVLIERLAEAIPDVRERIEVCETGTPHTMKRYSWNPLGSIYGYASTPTSHSIHRPEARTSVPGLYLAGAWTFPGAGFTGAMASGYRTAGLVFQDVEGGPRPAS